MFTSDHFEFLLLNPKDLKVTNYFWCGFIFFVMGDILSQIEINYIICQSMKIMGLILFVPSSIFLFRVKFNNTYLKVIYILYIFWLMTVVLRGFSLDIHSIEYLIYGDIFPYLVPLVLFFPQNIFFYKNVFKIIVLFGFFYLFFDSIFIKDLLNRDVANTFSKKIIETFSKSLALPATFLILTYSYQSKKIKIFAMFIAVIAILFAIIRARRGLLFILISPVLFAVIISLMESKKKISIVFISLISVGLIGLYGLQIFNESSLFSAFRSRVDEDTRSGVEDCFKSDMKRSDWIIGKGINGKYYCPGVDLGNTTGYRSVIETDYENIILKGGIVSLSLLLLITIPAAIKGIFHSKNILSKAAGFGILAWLMSLYPSEGVAFSLNYIILWLLVGICYNKTIRDIPESIMKYNFSGISSISTEI